jgi:oxygen-dependent protoporphyrinogen oxidase
MTKHVVIVGGGMTGLAAAYRLTRLAADGLDVRVTLLESSNRLGGKILTEQTAGFAVECGPDSFITAKPQALDLVRELGLAGRLLTTDRTNTDVHVFVRGKLRKLPAGLLLMAPTRVLPFLASDLMTWRGKLRMALDLVLPPAPPGDVSMGDFTRRRFGAEALRTIVQPVMAGIHAGDADELSLKSTFPQFLELERKYGSLSRGLRIAARGRPPTAAGLTMFVTLAGGLYELVEALAGRLEPGSVRFNAKVSGIIPRGQSYRVILEGGEPIEADAVILTAPSYQAAEILEVMDPKLSIALRSIAFTSTATLTLAYDASKVVGLPKGFGFVVARGESQALAAATFTATKFPGRVPAGTAVIRCFLGGAGREKDLEKPDDELVATVRGDLQRILGVRAEPSFARLCRWTGANPQYTVGHETRLKRIDECVVRHSGLLLAGASYRGVGIPDCAAAGMAAAENLRDLFREHRREV